MLEPIHSVNETAVSYATKTDFCKVFTEEMDSLYLLSLLLTADNDKAQQCFVSAMGECVEETDVFVSWARLSARQAVLKYAIQMIMPVWEHTDRLSFVSCKGPATWTENNSLAAILALGAFERFVFVMSILEGRSEQECSILLGCSRRDVKIARVLALKRLANTDVAYAHADEILQA
jgi:hypothetical protein